MAERVAQEDGIHNNVPSDQVEAAGGNGDAVGGTVDAMAAADDQVRKLKEEVWRGKQKRRCDIEARYSRVFGCRQDTNDAGATDADRDLFTIHEWEFGFGWDGLIESLAAAIDREMERDPRISTGYVDEQGLEMPPFRITQMKEKFGGLRFYYEGGNIRIHGLAEMTEQMSYSICEVCSDIGQQSKNGAWMSTLCPDCASRLGYELVDPDDGEGKA